MYLTGDLASVGKLITYVPSVLTEESANLDLELYFLSL